MKDALSNRRAGSALFVISAPSGAGKTTIVRRLRRRPDIAVSISHTTRQPRGDEKEGEAYFFIDEAAFAARRAAGDFLEWAEVYGHFYGTSAAWVATTQADGKAVILEIDCQGALQVKQKKPDACLIFIAPPDMATLRRRLLGRGEDDKAAIDKRLAMAESEIAQQNHFDCVIINDDIDAAVAKVEACVDQHLNHLQGAP